MQTTQALAGRLCRYENGGHAAGIAQKTKIRQMPICPNASHASMQENWRNVADSMTHQGLEINPPCTNRLRPPLQKLSPLLLGSVGEQH